jgi:hypothetical protein
MLFFSSEVFSQHFVFIEEASKQPFYVRVGEESHSSSAGGHIILAPVKDSLYNFYIGFPKNKFGEQLFVVDVKRDMGFELRHVGGGWQLYDLEKQDVIKPVLRVSTTDTGVKKTDSYSMMMAGLVNDSSVLYTGALPPDSVAASDVVVKSADSSAKPAPVVVANNTENVQNAAAGVKKPDSVLKKQDAAMKNTPPPVAANTDSATKSARSVVESQSSQQPAQPIIVHDPRDIVRYETQNVREGKLMIYLDRTGPVTDTIRIIVPRL